MLTIRSMLIFAGVLILLGGTPFLGQAAPPAQEPTPAAVFESMQKKAGGNLEIYWDEKTGVPRFLTGQIPTELSVASNEANAIAFFNTYADLYQMENPNVELSMLENSHDELGMEHIWFQQVFDNVPVWGAVMVVHSNSEGQITAVNGEYIPKISVSVTPDFSLEQGMVIVKHDLGDDEAEFRAESSELVIYARHNHSPTLAWKINVFSHDPLGHWLYFVDAHTGAIIHQLNQLDTAKALYTYDANYSTSLPGLLRCTNSDGTCPGGDTDELAAHQNTSIVYDYYFDTFGRDSYNDNDGAGSNGGAILRSSVHYSFFYNNAFWNGSQMVYGDGDGTTFIGFARSLDVVGHELTHAVTEYEANLIYEDQSGALNESYSDVFGTLIEFYGDFANADWLAAEDIYTPGTVGDAMRDLSNPSGGAAGIWNPTLPFGEGQPDHMSLYSYLPLALDNGGVHINSGIPNKAAYLISEGGSFYGVNVAGIGRSNLAQIYYRTLTQYLTPSSTFMDARNASIQACIDLFGNGHTNCDSVQNGFAAVGIGDSTTSPANIVYLPVIMKSGATCNNASGIYGQVLQNNAPVSGISLNLRLCTSGVGCYTYQTTTTDSNGCYNFAGVAGLSGNTYYYVGYLNPSYTYNNRLYTWLADPISAYTAGENIRGGDFNIADVVLNWPASSSPAPLPMTFSWNVRSASELYQWELFSLGCCSYTSLAPEYGRNSFTLTSLPSGFGTHTVYGWDALVYSSDGYGVPYYYNYVNFSTSTLLPEAPSTQPMARVPAWQVRTLEDFEDRE